METRPITFCFLCVISCPHVPTFLLLRLLSSVFITETRGPLIASICHQPSLSWECVATRVFQSAGRPTPQPRGIFLENGDRQIISGKGMQTNRQWALQAIHDFAQGIFSEESVKSSFMVRAAGRQGTSRRTFNEFHFVGLQRQVGVR